MTRPPPSRSQNPKSTLSCSAEQLVRKTAKTASFLPRIFEGLEAEAASTRFACSKSLRLLAGAHPDLLYPHFGFFVRLLDHGNQIFQWEAARVIALLARVDTANRFKSIFRKYFAPISGPVMISAATAIQGSVAIARARPEMADRIAKELLRVSRAHYRTAECRNVAIGHTILAFEEIFLLLRKPAPVVRFVRAQLKNPRASTRRKAAQFLKRCSVADSCAGSSTQVRD